MGIPWQPWFSINFNAESEDNHQKAPLDLSTPKEPNQVARLIQYRHPAFTQSREVNRNVPSVNLQYPEIIEPNYQLQQYFCVAPTTDADIGPTQFFATDEILSQRHTPPNVLQPTEEPVLSQLTLKNTLKTTDNESKAPFINIDVIKNLHFKKRILHNYLGENKTEIDVNVRNIHYAYDPGEGTSGVIVKRNTPNMISVIREPNWSKKNTLQNNESEEKNLPVKKERIKKRTLKKPKKIQEKPQFHLILRRTSKEESTHSRGSDQQNVWKWKSNLKEIHPSEFPFTSSP